VLVDDLQYFPRYDAVVLYRLDVPARFPKAWAALQQLSQRIDERAMIAMNARAELKGVAFDQIARDFLQGKGQASDARRGFAGKLLGPDLGRLTAQHLMLVLVSVGVAVLIGVPLAIAVVSRNAWRASVLGITSVLQTIPSLAMLAVLISLMGAIGTGPALVALTLYALLPIVRNTCTGLAEVPAGLKLASLALGLQRRDRLLRIELPLALPTIMAGINQTIMLALSMVVIAAMIGAGGLGREVWRSIQRLEAGAGLEAGLAIVIVAVILDRITQAMAQRMRPSGANPA
jgi:osmoprotectant transport system permease protein